MATRLNPEIKLEKELAAQIYNALQGSTVEAILKSARSESGSDNVWRNLMEGHSLKVDRSLLPEFHALCEEVKASLGFTERVDFYVTGDSTINAFSVCAEREGEPHIINVNSALFSLMNDDEMRFVLGHELGHIINRDTALVRLINFVFPSQTARPHITLQYKIRLHEQLAELVADRYGYMACGNLHACVTAFFKMASGLDLDKMNVSLEALLADNSKRLEFFLSDKGLSRQDHPVHPIRVAAIRLFAEAGSDEELEKGMDELISILLKVGNGPLDEDLAMFIASAGLILAGADGEVTREEVEHIIQNLSEMKIFPKDFLDAVASADVYGIFNASVSNLIEKEPGIKEGLVGYLINLCLADKDISDKEIEAIYSFGTGLGYSEKEISSMFASCIQQNFVPSLHSIY